jgi:hypothetical protein
MMRPDENASSIARIEALDTSVFAIQPARSVAEASLRDATMRAGVRRLARVSDRAEAVNAAMRSKAEAFANSTSWRITTPTPAAARHLKGGSA